MMKYALSMILLLTLAGCSSSDKKSAASTETPAAVTESTPAAKEGGPPAAKSAANSLENLSDAIKSGSDDNIYRAATTVLAQNPVDTKALNALGLVHLRKGRPLAAQLMFAKALKSTPNSSELHSNMGLAHLALKQNDEAIRAFKKALSVNAEDFNAAGNLASIYLEQRDFAKAYGVLNATGSKPKDAKYLNNFAIASSSQGKLDQAESLYRQSVRLAPNDPQLLLNYAIFQIDYQHQYKDGLETLNRIRSMSPAESIKNQTNTLEIRAKAGLK